MKYQELVDVYSSLEATTKRLEKTQIISDFLKKLDEETIEKCEVYNYLGEDAEDMYYELWKKVK